MDMRARSLPEIPPSLLRPLGAGNQATSPNGPLANTHLDAGMIGVMQEQNKKGIKLSQEQQCNLDAFDMGSDSMKAQMGETSPNANNVPNSPQNAYMEGPMMNMDKLVVKPENVGLRPNSTRFMQGMMTFFRVLPPEQYDQVISAMCTANRLTILISPSMPLLKRVGAASRDQITPSRSDLRVRRRHENSVSGA
jgi:hypothetical protein